MCAFFISPSKWLKTIPVCMNYSRNWSRFTAQKSKSFMVLPRPSFQITLFWTCSCSSKEFVPSYHETVKVPRFIQWFTPLSLPFLSSLLLQLASLKFRYWGRLQGSLQYSFLSTKRKKSAWFRFDRGAHIFPQVQMNFSFAIWYGCDMVWDGNHRLLLLLHNKWR